jgi:polyisoprenoid-binding protein YceI
MQNFVRIIAIVALSSVLVACPARQARPPLPAPSAAVPAVGAPDVQGAVVYTIDSAASDVQIHVFRGGTLARMGHNHVMTSKDVTGRVWLRDEIARSGFELAFPVEKLIVDDPQARAAAGSDFPGEIKADDRDGTRKNMLRAEVLDAAQFPTISLRSVQVAGSKQAPDITARITIKGAAQDVRVPASLQIQGERLTARGEFDIQQTNFGIKPFSIGLGALEVQDKVHLKFSLVAQRDN